MSWWSIHIHLHGCGLPSQFPPFRYFPKFSSLSKHTLTVKYRVYIWHAAPQLSCGDTCQIWRWFEESKFTFPRSKILPTEKLTTGALVTAHSCKSLTGKPHLHSAKWIHPDPRFINDRPQWFCIFTESLLKFSRYKPCESYEKFSFIIRRVIIHVPFWVWWYCVIKQNKRAFKPIHSHILG